jgi:hypothetical protein
MKPAARFCAKVYVTHPLQTTALVALTLKFKAVCLGYTMVSWVLDMA